MERINERVVRGPEEPKDKTVTWIYTENGSEEVKKKYIDGQWTEVDTPSGDDFPYEYYCPDDFSIVVNPEDWTGHHGMSSAQKQIPIQLKVPESYKLKMGTCNNTDYSAHEERFIVPIDEISWDCYIALITESNTINIDVDSELIPSEISSFTLNFKDLIFLGNKK